MEAIENRLEVYNEQTAPVIDFYRNEGLLVSVTASDSEAAIAEINRRL